MALHFHELKISSVETQGVEGFALAFEVPEKLGDAFHFVPGQHLTLRAEIGGEDVRRSYSICSARGEAGLKVGIRMLDDGKFSSFAKTRKPGDRLLVMPPQGRFAAEIGGTHDYLLIAAGSGITPVLSIARSVLEGEPESRITLVYGNKSTASIMFREELDALKDRFIERFSLIHILSRENQDVDLANGRIDLAKLKLMQQRGLINPPGHDGIFLCGPQEMIETCSAGLVEMGAKKGHIHFELFTPADGMGISPEQRAKKRAMAAGNVEVVTILDGISRSFRMDGKTATVLGAAHEAGVELPFSCAGGMCCTCRCHIAEGEAEMDVNYSLQPWEIEAGFILACQARPKTAKLVLDFDTT